MTSKQKAGTLRHLALQRFDALFFEFHDRATLGADQVVVVVAFGALVASLPVEEVALDGQAALGEQLHGSVNGGVPNARVDALDGVVQLLDADVALARKKHLRDVVALRGPFESEPVQVFAEDPEAFGDRLGSRSRQRGGGLALHDLAPAARSGGRRAWASSRAACGLSSPSGTDSAARISTSASSCA